MWLFQGSQLNIDMGAELLALGDAENDAGMLDLAAIGVAVANASPPALDAADYIMEYSNNCEPTVA